MPLAQEEIVAAEICDAGIVENAVGEIFVGGERRGGRVVLRIPGATPGAEEDACRFRSDAKDEPGAAVDVFEMQPELAARPGGIGCLVRVEGGLSRAKFLQVPHAVGDDLPFRLFRRIYLTIFCSWGAAINHPNCARFQQVNCAPEGRRRRFSAKAAQGRRPCNFRTVILQCSILTPAENGVLEGRNSSITTEASAVWSGRSPVGPFARRNRKSRP